jgi:hypothetical protein
VESAVADEGKTTEPGTSDDDWSFYRGVITGFVGLIVFGGLGRTFDLSYPALCALALAGGLALSVIERRLRR